MRIVNVIDRPGWDELDYLDNDTVLNVGDTFRDETLQRWLSKGTPRYIVSNVYSHREGMPDNFYCAPFFLNMFKNGLLDDFVETPFETKYIFNFCINKKQINRHLCLKLVEYFQLQDYDYTWSGVGQDFDMSEVILEMDKLGDQNPIKDRGGILSPIQLPRKFINYPGQQVHAFGVSEFGEKSSPWGWTWKNGLNKLFSYSAVSLITESSRFEKGAVWTEKMFFSVLGLTFPIWVGGHAHPRDFIELGFDNFSDIIDHSYADYDTLIERCYYAFEKNKKLLTDREYAAELRIKHYDRLLKNRKFLLDLGFQEYFNRVCKTWPQDLVEIMPLLCPYVELQ